MWAHFFFDETTNLGDGIVLENGSKVGLQVYVQDAAVLTETGGEPQLCTCTKSLTPRSQVQRALPRSMCQHVSSACLVLWLLG
jgi:hypothetical protein